MTLGEELASIAASPGTWGSRVERERKRRIDVSAWAYAYEFDHDPLVEDHVYDREAALIDVSIDTGRADLDHFFRTEFGPETGMWVRRHPELEKLRRVVALKRSRPRTRWVTDLDAPMPAEEAEIVRRVEQLDLF